MTLDDDLKQALEDGTLKEVVLKHGATTAPQAAKILRKEYGLPARPEDLGAPLFSETFHKNFWSYARLIRDHAGNVTTEDNGYIKKKEKKPKCNYNRHTLLSLNNRGKMTFRTGRKTTIQSPTCNESRIRMGTQ